MYYYYNRDFLKQNVNLNIWKNIPYFAYIYIIFLKKIIRLFNKFSFNNVKLKL